ncbi:hypothetical protein KP803_11700 [Vibrio sp. ZSDE26]|uniref:Uncharacterized protein n=1 Tax=Vibrio amylolyticus TaxID=2847292 RepID=A0A9X1XQX7_9VIBR|nr:hypothetical protein [Vibrio amylolyticus]MCK6263934.1 hypothetical protein [Vibrio amylolyticus]
MALIDELKEILRQMAPYGWGDLFSQHGLDICASDLSSELQKPLYINRLIPGFREFAKEGNKAITPSKPAHSLLYHAFASPLVMWADTEKKVPLTKFPSLHALNVIENNVYALANLKLHQLQKHLDSSECAVVVFANQYRVSNETVHKKHADMVYSRTGITRVGNAPPFYDEKRRSFVSRFADDTHRTRVLPAKFDAYLAMKVKGSKSILGHRFNVGERGDPFSSYQDEQLEFWVPIHKLFNGSECVKGLNLDLEYSTYHANEKIKKVHDFLSDGMALKVGSKPEQRGDYPFKINENIADYDAELGILCPTIHAELIQVAKSVEKLVGLRKPFSLPLVKKRHLINLCHSSLRLMPRAVAIASRMKAGENLSIFPRSTPELLYIRHAIKNQFTGMTQDVNWQDDLKTFLETNEDNILHYVDHTGDGYVKVSAIYGGGRLNRCLNIAAYSIVSAPDLLPYCRQTEIFDNKDIKPLWSALPFALSDTRLLPNIQSHPVLYHDHIGLLDTCTAILSTRGNGKRIQTKSEGNGQQISYLPDSATGVFCAGWDTSFDVFYYQGVYTPHLAGYGIASPYSEAAAGAFSLRSGIKPDITRSFWSNHNYKYTVVPLTDQEIGVNGGVGWDGEIGPILFTEDERLLVSYADFDRVDYTKNTIGHRINYDILARIDTKEYVERIKNFALVKRDPRVTIKMKLLSYIITHTNDVRVERYLFSEVIDTGRRDCFRVIAERKHSVCLELTSPPGSLRALPI